MTEHQDMASVLREAAERNTRLRFFCTNMSIMAEGRVAYVTEGIVALYHRDEEEPDEFLRLNQIVKVQKLTEPRY